MPLEGPEMMSLFLLLPAAAQETVWVEAEHLQGVRGYCWPATWNGW
jgi:hypothetical protein